MARLKRGEACGGNHGEMGNGGSFRDSGSLVAVTWQESVNIMTINV